jgi:hypothetical protein
MVASMGRMATGIGGKLPPALLLAKLKGSKSPEETNPEGQSEEDTENSARPSLAGASKSVFSARNIRRFTKGSSVWDKLKATAHFIEATKKNADFEKMFGEDKEEEDEVVYVEGDQKETQAEQHQMVDADAKAKAKEFDKKLAEIENMEFALARERAKMEKEREIIAFERESLELQLDEVVEKNEKLNLQIFLLEGELHSEKVVCEAVADPNNITMLSGENETLRHQLQREKRDSHLFLSEKDEEIKKLQQTMQELQQEEEELEETTVIPGGKSRERLQGELLLTVTKLHDRESIIHKQQKEAEEIRQEIATLQGGIGVQECKDEIAALTEQKEELKAKHDSERNKLVEKMKEKDAKVASFIGELAKLKQKLSEQGRQPPPVTPSITTSWKLPLLGVSSEPPPEPVSVQSFAFAPRARRGSEANMSVGSLGASGSLGEEASEEDKDTPEEDKQTPEEDKQTPEVKASWWPQEDQKTETAASWGLW